MIQNLPRMSNFLYHILVKPEGTDQVGNPHRIIPAKPIPGSDIWGQSKNTVNLVEDAGLLLSIFTLTPTMTPTMVQVRLWYGLNPVTSSRSETLVSMAGVGM